MKKDKKKKDKLPFKQRLFNRMLEKPINDILYITYDMYLLSCKVYLDADKIPTFDEYCECVNDRLKSAYNGGVESC